LSTLPEALTVALNLLVSFKPQPKEACLHVELNALTMRSFSSIVNQS
jgi:hypothetical protein